MTNQHIPVQYYNSLCTWLAKGGARAPMLDLPVMSNYLHILGDSTLTLTLTNQQPKSKHALLCAKCFVELVLM